MSQEDNILLVANYDSNVGYAWWLMENFWAKIASHFVQEGKYCFLVYPSVSIIPASIDDSDLLVHELNFGNRRITNLLKIASFIRNHGINYIYFSDYQYSSFFYIFLKIIGVRKLLCMTIRQEKEAYLPVYFVFAKRRSIDCHGLPLM